VQTQSHLVPVAPPAVVDFSDIYRRHALTVARWAARLGGPQVDAEDIVQEVFLIVNRRLSEFRGAAKITTWLFRITERTVQNHRRKQRVRRFFARHFRPGDAQLAVALTPAEMVERREVVVQLYRRLDSLAERYRKVLILFELEGHSTEQIAELLGIKPGTVRVWLHRARAQFLATPDGDGR
jgi:RNA polymerase sigma-70 factor (ECF subfamily)